jgi:hypothetical protein
MITALLTRRLFLCRYGRRFELLFSTNLLFSLLGRTTSLPIKEHTVDILLNLFKSTYAPSASPPIVCCCFGTSIVRRSPALHMHHRTVPSFLPMLKKTANGGLTLLDRAIKYLGAEHYEPAEVWQLTSF